MSLVQADTCFFSQRKFRVFQRRFRKTLDDYSLYGERRETLLTFKGGGDAESVSGRQGRPGSAARSVRSVTACPAPAKLTTRLSENPAPLVLPVIDPAGPTLVSGGGSELPEETKNKADFLHPTEEKEISRLSEKGQGYRINEVKFASSSILSNLSKLLYSTPEVSLSVELAKTFSQNFQQLTADTVVERRKWQTDCYRDFEQKNTTPFLTSPPEPSVRATLEASVDVIVKQQDKGRNRQVRMSRQTMESSLVSRPSTDRPQTARSVISNFSYRSDVSSVSGGSRYEYDTLPAELRPSILLYRRESRAPKLSITGPKTRLEKLQGRRKKAKKAKKAKSKSPPKVEKLEEEEEEEVEQEETPTTGLLQQVQLTDTINFSMASPYCREKGWLVTPSDAEDPEANTLFIWEKQIHEMLRKREESKLIARQRGEDGPLVVKFYNDPQTRTLRSKHQRSASFPLPAILGKLPPSVASFSTPIANEAHLIGDKIVKVFVVVLPDGSGHCNYHSGRQAVCMSRMGDGNRGLCTVVYDDNYSHSLLAYFTPTGMTCCYHRNGAIHLLSNQEGGTLFDQDGNVTRKWTWPPPNSKLPVSVSVQLNAHMAFQCSCLTNMVLRFSCRGQMYRFNVGPSLETLTTRPIGDTILSTLLFTSQAARECGGSMKILTRRATAGVIRPSTAKNKQRSKSTVVASSSLVWENERMVRELNVYRDKIKTLVNKWMDHYRQSIGISLPAHHTSRSPTPSPSGQFPARLVKSSMGYAGDSLSRPSTRGHHPRHLTHPLPSRASPLPEPFFPESSGPSRASGSPGPSLVTALTLMEGSRAVSPSFPRPASPLDYVHRPQSIEQARPFKVGVSKPRTKKPGRMKCGCPVALHSMLLKEMEVMPACRCDKRRPPYISDLEYDVFLQSHVPRDQLVIVCVVSSTMENSCPCEPMLDSIHYSQNTVRFSPCTQCSGDSFRLMKYDVCRALKDLIMASPVPLLVERHNATPGMFLMYLGSQLVHADYMFNGYGTTKRDFMKQVHQCIENGRRGHFLPPDYKFTRKTGAKIQGGKTWAYPVSGVLQDLIPCTPMSCSDVSSVVSESNQSDSNTAVESKTMMDYIGRPVEDDSGTCSSSLSASKFSDWMRES